MRQATLALSLLILGLCQSVAIAFCPTNRPNEIFCDDFDTYCATGGYPEPTQSHCTYTDRTGGIPWVQKVWYQSTYGTTMTVEEGTANILGGVTSGRFFSKDDLGQQSVRDWVLSPPPGDPGQVLDIHRFVGKVFGEQYAAVGASDAEPLVMEFLTGANVGKLLFSSGFMELAMGEETNDLNRANTDYAKWPKAYCCGSLTVTKGPWPVICAQGNADPAIPVEAGCPSIETSLPPVHQAIAVGALAVLDANPCHCEKMDSRPRNDHLALFDGQLWWTLRANSPVASTGTVLAKDGGPTPSDVIGGDFALSSPGTSGKSYNAIKLTIKATTITVELTAWVKSANGYTYVVTNTMENIPRKYTGPFDRIHSGVGPGCVLATGSWDTCKTIDGRYALTTPEGWFVDFDDFVLHGGYGYSVEGACCNAVDGACSMTVQNECPGRWTKSGQSCGKTVCCPQIYGDTNFDGFTDMTDFGALQACVTTGGNLPMYASCLCLDYNGDKAIGTAEVTRFAECANGPEIPGNVDAPCAGRGW